MKTLMNGENIDKETATLFVLHKHKMWCFA